MYALHLGSADKRRAKDERQERAKGEHEHGGVAGEYLLERQLGPLEAHARRKLALGDRLHDPDRSPRADAGAVPPDTSADGNML